ncbi:PH domain-containing protein [Jiella sonneratiae]|uniref:PH domain-containing protein n=1 Tax=Jiella sonneratiae TaxID=2816856 RepID=A0ABS3IXJ5_9HYPH|nr:PH domain-containing protein [Jiella sonneratiae]MBO0902127.1 PH domain-containing protein [Jiella sonneratiae]
MLLLCVGCLTVSAFLWSVLYLRLTGVFSPMVSGRLVDAILIGSVAAVVTVLPLLRLRTFVAGTSAVLSKDGLRAPMVFGDRFIPWGDVVAVEAEPDRRLVRLLRREPSQTDRLFRNNWCLAISLQFTDLSVDEALHRMTATYPGLAARIRRA